MNLKLPSVKLEVYKLKCFRNCWTDVVSLILNMNYESNLFNILMDIIIKAHLCKHSSVVSKT